MYKVFLMSQSSETINTICESGNISFSHKQTGVLGRIALEAVKEHSEEFQLVFHNTTKKG